MPNSTGPKLISHLADEQEPTIDPRLGGAFGLRDEMRAHAARLEAMRAAYQRGELGPSDMPALYQAIQDGFSFHAMAAAQLPTAEAQVRAFITQLPRELCRIRREYIEISRRDPGARKLLPVAVKGSTRKGAELGYFKSPLRDARYGFLQRRSDDCLRAALATCVQAPMPEVPELKPDQLLAAGKDPEEIGRVVLGTLGAWIERNALTIVAHSDARLPVASACWIGLIHNPDDPDGAHCLVMRGREPVFDTAWLTPPRTDEPVSWHGLDDIEFGLTIERR